MRIDYERTTTWCWFTIRHGWTRTYYDPSFCPFAARNKHLLRHRVKGEERWCSAIDVDCRGTLLPLFHFPLSTFPSSSSSSSSSSSFSRRSACPRRIFLPRRFFCRVFHDLTFHRLVFGERNGGGVLPRRRKTAVVKRPWATLPTSGRKTLLGLLLSVRMKDRSYLQATPVNGRWESEEEEEEKKGGKKKGKEGKSWQGWKEQTRQIAPRDEATIRFSLSVSWSKPFLFSPSPAGRLCAPFPCNSLVSSRRSFLVRHTICSYEENVPVKWERGSSIRCRTCRQHEISLANCLCFARCCGNDILYYRSISRFLSSLDWRGGTNDAGHFNTNTQ